MFGKLKALILKHWEVLVYLFFGGLTTLVNLAVYWPLHHYLHIPASVSNVIAWAVSVLFAFLTNKSFVFKSNDWSLRVTGPELLKFVSCRVASGVFETVFIGLTVDWLHWHGLLMKIIVSIVVVILNYIGSKLLVFRKK